MAERVVPGCDPEIFRAPSASMGTQFETFLEKVERKGRCKASLYDPRGFMVRVSKSERPYGPPKERLFWMTNSFSAPPGQGIW